MERSPTSDAWTFHQRLPAYAPTPLVEAPSLAQRLGVSHVWVKDESRRLGLPSFKILGASWAVYRALSERFGDLEPWANLGDLATGLAPHLPLSLATATDGNHGRAVARMAQLLGMSATVFVPEGTAGARIEAIRGEGAAVEIVAGSYDDAVERSSLEASDRCLVISDTSWEGYERVPAWIIEGYSTILWEVQQQLAESEAADPDVVAVQTGVGAFAAAVVTHFRRPELTSAPAILSVEPADAACLLASVAAGRIVTVPGPHRSIMAGLNCGTPSWVAWPTISSGIDVYVAIDDARAEEAMRLLDDVGVESGESGAAGLGGLLELVSVPGADEARAALGLERRSSVLVISTEGATDPARYHGIVGGR